MIDDWEEWEDQDRWRLWWAAGAERAGHGWEHGVSRHVEEYGGHWPRVTWYGRMRCSVLSVVIPAISRAKMRIRRIKRWLSSLS